MVAIKSLADSILASDATSTDEYFPLSDFLAVFFSVGDCLGLVRFVVFTIIVSAEI